LSQYPTPSSSTLFPYTTLFRSRRGGEDPRQIDRLPGGHPARDGVRIEALRAQEQRRLPARVPVSAHDGDRPARIERQRVEPRKRDRKSTRLNSSHRTISYAVFC